MARVRLRLIAAAAWLVAATSPAASAAEPCFQVPREVAAPLDGLLYRAELKPADNRPGVVEFASAERLIVNLRRAGAPADAAGERKVALTVSLKRPDGGFEPHCTADVVLRPPMGDASFFVYSPQAEQLDWRLELAGPAGAGAVAMEIRRFPRKALDRSEAYTDAGARGFTLECNADWQVPELAAAEQPRQHGGALVPGDGVQTFFVHSRGPVQVDILRPPDPARPEGSHLVFPGSPPLFELKASAKGRQAGPFSGTCLQHPGVYGRKAFERHVLTAKSEFASGDLVWRIELQAPPGSDAGATFALRYPPPQQAHYPSELLCAAPFSARTATGENERRFAGATVLSVNIADTEGLLTPDARAEVTRHLLLGMTLWRPVCYHCTDDQLAIAQVDGRRYVLDTLLQSLQELYAQGSPLAPAPVIAPGDPAALTARMPFYRYYPVTSAIGQRSVPRGGSPLMQYVPVAHDAPGFQALCRDDFSQLPPSLRRIRLAWGCPGETADLPPGGFRASAQIAFRTTGLDGCTHDANTVACESSAFRIDFNARDFRFVAHPTRAVVAGAGARDVNLLQVMTHEIGHWIGMGHLDDAGSIMNESLDSARCIDTASSHALNILAAGARFPVRTPQALLFQAPRKAPR